MHLCFITTFTPLRKEEEKNEETKLRLRMIIIWKLLMTMVVNLFPWFVHRFINPRYLGFINLWFVSPLVSGVEDW